MAVSIRNRIVCVACVGDSVLAERIRDAGESRRCSYCRGIDTSWPLTDVAEQVDETYRKYYQPGEDIPCVGDGDDVSYEQEGEDPSSIVQQLVGCEVELADDLVALLADRESYDVGRDGAVPWFDERLNYTFKRPHNSDYYLRLWRQFEDDIKHRGRYFSARGTRLLRMLLRGTPEPATLRDGPPGPVDCPVASCRAVAPDARLFRARIANSDEECAQFLCNPAIELAAPPGNVVRPGRMNPAGVPVFYAALDRETAVSEVRAPVGSLVVVAAFRVVHPIRILDLTLLGSDVEPTSMFDDKYDDAFAKERFFSEIDRLVGRPVLPCDEQIEYVPTQVLFEYLIACHRPRVDGIVYSSTQTGAEGRNIAVFAHACGVRQPSDSPTRHEAHVKLHMSNGIAWLRPARNGTPLPSSRQSNSLERIVARHSTFRTVKHRPRLEVCADGIEVCRVQKVTYTVNEAHFLPDRCLPRAPEF